LVIEKGRQYRTGSAHRRGADKDRTPTLDWRTDVPVEIRLPTVLRPAAGGKSTVSVDGSTIGEVLTNLVDANPGMKGQVLTDDGELHRFVNVYLNDDDVRYLDKLATAVSNGDTISILPAVAGG
jgi:molybdopterin synthase sulfur carrier subunit